MQLLAPLPIGFAVFLVHLATIPITGTGINPARSLGAAIIYNQQKVWDDHVRTESLCRLHAFHIPMIDRYIYIYIYLTIYLSIYIANVMFYVECMYAQIDRFNSIDRIDVLLTMIFLGLSLEVDLLGESLCRLDAFRITMID
jgi:hypothetical protein